MSQLKFDIEYEHYAYISGPKGEKIIVGKVLVHDEVLKNTCSVLVELADGLPEELRKTIESEPRILQFLKKAIKTSGIIIIPTKPKIELN